MKSHLPCGKPLVFCGKLCGKPCGKQTLPVEYFLTFHSLWKTCLFYPQVFHRRQVPLEHTSKAFQKVIHSFHSPYYNYYLNFLKRKKPF
jgi:hypothetical protein